MVEDSHFVRDAVYNRLRGDSKKQTPYGAVSLKDGTESSPTNEARGLWATAFGSWATTNGNGNASKLDRTTGGVLVGGDGVLLDTWRIGAVGGWSQAALNSNSAGADVDSYHLGLYAGRQWNAIGLRSGLAYTWHDVESERKVLSESLSADYDAGAFQAFAELGWRLGPPSFGVEPFANVAYVSLKTDAFTETGGSAALAVTGSEIDTVFTTLGIRLSSGFDLGGVRTVARGTLGWQHAYGDTIPFSTHAFTSGDTFTIGGVPIAEDVAVIEMGLDMQISEFGTLGLSYSGQYGSGLSESGINATLNLKF